MDSPTIGTAGVPRIRGTTTTAIAVAAEGSMKAILQERYGAPDVLELRDVEVPEIADDRVLVRVRASSVNALDWHRLRGEPFLVRMSEGLRRPKSSQIGADVAGTVEAVGKDVTLLRPGDNAFGTSAGTFAEFVRGREARLVPMPEGFTFEQAAAVPVAATTALQALRDQGKVQPGQAVLINGAGGGVGTFAVQLAKAFGATVTAVSSTRNMDLLRSIGADEVVDYTREDFTERRQKFDLLIDIAGTRPLSATRRAITQEGTYVVVGGPSGRWIRPMDRMINVIVRRRFAWQRLVSFLAQITREDLLVLGDFMEAGKLTPVIDRTFPLSEVPAAIRYVEERRSSGKVVITVGEQ
jgi:NADPH:quinone reductase-like Zn-dependent oxidoreductase